MQRVEGEGWREGGFGTGKMKSEARESETPGDNLQTLQVCFSCK